MVCVTRATVTRPKMSPRPRPASVPTTPANSASPRMKAKIWRRLAPRARSVAMSGRRCTTLKTTVL